MRQARLPSLSAETYLEGELKSDIRHKFVNGEVYAMAGAGEAHNLHLSSERGFTLVEMITIMVILGVLAAFAAPRFFVRNTFDSRGFYDQTISTLRYAQKTAIAQRRLVCVTFSVNSITLMIDSDTPPNAACNAAPAGNLTSPEGNTPYIVTAQAGVTFTPVPTNFNFDALGRPTGAQNITVNGYGAPIVLEAETGYVH